MAHVEIVPVPEFRDRRLVRATSKAGDVREFMTTWWDPALRDKVYVANVYPPQRWEKPSAEELNRILAERADSWREMCGSGEVVFLMSIGSIRISPEDRRQWEQIVNVVRILDSELTSQDKLNTILDQLYSEADDLDRPGQNEIKILKQLVENYRPDPQLDERIRELTPKVHIPLWSPPEKAK